MKKILAFLLCIIAVLSVVACKKPQVEDSDGITVVNNGDRIYATDADQKSLSVIKIGFTEAGFGMAC